MSSSITGTSKWYCLTHEEIAFILDYAEKANPALYKKIVKQKTRIKTSSAKAKGRNLQQWVCREIGAMLNIPYKQSDDQCEIHSREMGQQGVDIVLRGKAYQRFKFDIECKNTENMNFVEVIEQAQANNKEEDRDWMLVHQRKALKQRVVIITWDAFKRLWLRGQR